MVGVPATIGLTLLRVFPAVLGLIAGIFEIPLFVGPVIGMRPGRAGGGHQRPASRSVDLIFIVIQQVENAVLVLRISGKAVESHLH